MTPGRGDSLLLFGGIAGIEIGLRERAIAGDDFKSIVDDELSLGGVAADVALGLQMQPFERPSEDISQIQIRSTIASTRLAAHIAVALRRTSSISADSFPASYWENAIGVFDNFRLDGARR